MGRCLVFRIAGGLLVIAMTTVLSLGPATAQGGGLGGVAPAVPGAGANQGEQGSGRPSAQPGPPVQQPDGRLDGAPEGAPAQHDQGGCRYRERKLELIV
jgi:hypothetical protein